MKKRFSILLPLSAIFLSALLFSACKKNLDKVSHTPASGLMAFNLAPDQTSVGFALSGNIFTRSPLGFTNYTGSYLGVYTGTRNVTTYDFSTQATLADTTQLFADSAYYSAFFVGTNGKYKNVVVKDNFDSLTSASGQAYVRYVNAIPDSTLQPTVTVSSNGSNVFNTAAPFPSVSYFKGVTPGDISINVNDESTVNKSRTISVEKGKIYTILLVGQPGATDSTKTVQIKFIQNGQVTP
ncbi:DUF4397 domain-containing protein [Ginsengibacter hankyongi]|uniref:DUF4397 domain-containing protein n=1 Tax=Ginsengibacter hankyongi TaxID=2607284 RepID=A0A5J5IHR6_9BACT|nr:DUF4397 domain-containing protein [Ginsengibacter hankyongi]KAA9037574.1 DUF4397 domain-containing protein [Ginsengibacter hankyongi]